MDGPPFAADSHQPALWHLDAARGPSTPSLDHLVRACEQRWRDFEAERFGGRQIDYEVELGRLLNRDFARLCPAQNPVDMVSGAPVQVRVIWSIGDETSSLDILLGDVDTRQSRAHRQHIDANSIREYERVARDIKGVGGAPERLEGGRNILCSPDSESRDLEPKLTGCRLNRVHFEHDRGIVGVPKDSQPVKLGDDLLQQFKPLGSEVGYHD